MSSDSDHRSRSSRAALAVGAIAIGGLAACFGAAASFAGTPALGLTRSESFALTFLGLLAGLAGHRVLRRFRPRGACDGAFLQSSFADGKNPHDLHTPAQLGKYTQETAQRHQKTVLWSLPFWLTTLWFLLIGKGELGGPTVLGISNLWLMALTLGLYFIHRFYYWRCPACDGRLPKKSDRLICDQCGIVLSGVNSVYASAKGEVFRRK